VNNKKGILIVVEGIDGAGKSTLAKGLANKLTTLGKDVILTFEPTAGQYGRRLRESFTSEKRLTLDEELELFMLDRKEHVESLLIPALSKGKVIICDRYYFSTMAYQGARGADPQDIQARNEAFYPVPDLLLIPVLPAREAVNRIRIIRKDRPNNFEQLAYLEKVSMIFDNITGDYVERLDARLGIEELLGEAVKVYEKRFCDCLKDTSNQ